MNQKNIDKSVQIACQLFPQRYEIDYVRVYQLSDEIELYGDVNQDNELNILDIVMIIQFIIGDSTLEEQQQLIADVNQDSSVNILDIVILIDNIID